MVHTWPCIRCDRDHAVAAGLEGLRGRKLLRPGPGSCRQLAGVV